jgi:diaminohydroxyphosphoribosylaminopyrimidine deaminase/5-amino-6-(5-phosphoribosylamino)uracil reductase
MKNTSVAALNCQNGLGTTYPNPLVGSVIVYEETKSLAKAGIKAGEPHAEVNAVNSVKINRC